MNISRERIIMGTFSKEEYANIIYQILYDSELSNELVKEIILLPEEIKIKTIKIK